MKISSNEISLLFMAFCFLSVLVVMLYHSIARHKACFKKLLFIVVEFLGMLVTVYEAGRFCAGDSVI